jgi:NAD(P)-dependent dehydrogenase (short-subunit alcohol dehydrogenase family)
MRIYRANPKDGAAWVTGASTGIGRRLALELAREGYTVAATARDEERLATLVGEASGLPGKIATFPCDVADAEAMQRTVASIEGQLGPIVLAVFNAGIFFPVKGDALGIENFASVFRINLFGVIHGLVPVVDSMHMHGRGHIAIVGSITGYGGVPLSAAYGASKAALNNMAEALKFDFDKMNIRIQMINPGFVDTPLTKRTKFPMPGLMTVDGAVSRIIAGLKNGGFEISFPRRLSWPMKFLNVLPHPLYFEVLNQVMGWRKRPSRRFRAPK